MSLIRVHECAHQLSACTIITQKVNWMKTTYFFISLNVEVSSRFKCLVHPLSLSLSLPKKMINNIYHFCRRYKLFFHFIIHILLVVVSHDRDDFEKMLFQISSFFKFLIGSWSSKNFRPKTLLTWIGSLWKFHRSWNSKYELRSAPTMKLDNFPTSWTAQNLFCFHHKRNEISVQCPVFVPWEKLNSMYTLSRCQDGNLVIYNFASWILVYYKRYMIGSLVNVHSND